MSIALGKAEDTADCTAEEAAAWYFEYCSRERMTLNCEDGNPARMKIRERETRKYEKVFAFVRKMQFPLWNREWVVKFILKKNKDKSITMAGV